MAQKTNVMKIRMALAYLILPTPSFAFNHDEWASPTAKDAREWLICCDLIDIEDDEKPTPKLADYVERLKAVPVDAPSVRIGSSDTVKTYEEHGKDIEKNRNRLFFVIGLYSNEYKFGQRSCSVGARNKAEAIGKAAMSYPDCGRFTVFEITHELLKECEVKRLHDSPSTDT